MLGIGKTRQHIGSYVKYIWKIKSRKTAKLGGNKILDYFLRKIFMSFREGTNMLVKCLHIFTLLFLIFRSILTFVVGSWCCCCLSAQECTQGRSLCCLRGVFPAEAATTSPLSRRQSCRKTHVFTKLQERLRLQSSSPGRSRRPTGVFTLRLSRVFCSHPS